jgi:putative hydrolase of the HAD superfamily
VKQLSDDSRARRSTGQRRETPVRAVISDFGGVLTSPLFECFAAYQRHSGVAPSELRDAMDRITAASGGRHPLHELERGLITEDEFLGRVEAALGRDVSLRGFRQIYFDALDRNDAMIELMLSLRGRGLRMALLTNNVREWEPHWRGLIPEIEEIFEIVVDSAFVGVRKPDPRIYELTVERLDPGLRPEECLFVDDVEVNCEAARALGMRAVHYRAVDEAVAEIQEAVGALAGRAR